MNRDQIILQLQQDYMKRREDNLRLYEQRVDEACERCTGLRELLNARHALVLGGIRASLVERKEGSSQQLPNAMNLLNDKIAAALGNFFTQDNLLQLRELALKEVALRVEKKVDSEVTGSETFRRDKLLAVIDSSEKRARRVIRKTARMATHLNAAFTVLYVQGDREADDRIPLARQRYLINNLNLATELGGEVRRIRSNSPVESIAGVCREQKINIVCIGRPEFSLFSLLKSAIRLRRLTVRLSRMNIDLFIFS